MEASGEVESLYRPIHQKKEVRFRFWTSWKKRTPGRENSGSNAAWAVVGKLDGQERTLIYLRYFAEKHSRQWERNGNFPGSGVQNGKENHSKFKRDDALRNRIVRVYFSWMSDTKVRIKVGG